MHLQFSVGRNGAALFVFKIVFNRALTSLPEMTQGLTGLTAIP